MLFSRAIGHELRLLVLAGLIAAAGLIPASASAQPLDLSFLATRAEASSFKETTRYVELQAFLEVLATTSDRFHVTTFGYTAEGRPLPLVVWGAVPDASPEAARATGRTRVYIQANIHAGEVAGKEAALMLLRSLAAGRHAAWADSLVLLVAPIYNADGNERVALDNRRFQHGPVGGMGQRPNAQGLDLNRDHMKLDSPEARSLAGLLADYDPHVAIDLHTTNGSFHAYHLTYAPPLHPNTPEAIDAYLRGELLPAVTDAIRDAYGWEMYYYGNVPRSDEQPLGWYTFDHRPRFSTNYMGLRNRLGILSEAYSYATFEERVLATLYFVEEILAGVYAEAGRVRAMTELADTTSVVGTELALRARHQRSEDPVEILMGDVVEEYNPYSDAVMYRRTDARKPVAMPEFGRFEPTETTRAPMAYFVPANADTVLRRLRLHGVSTERIEQPVRADVERFRIDSVGRAEHAYQGRRGQTVEGAYEPVTRELPAGTVVVPVDQPLGRLVVSLLEPRSDDGFAAWGLVALTDSDAEYPILRQPAPASYP